MASREDFDRLADNLEDIAAALSQSVAQDIGDIWSASVVESAQRAVNEAMAQFDGQTPMQNVIIDSQNVRMAIMEPIQARIIEIHDAIQGAMVAAVIEGYTDALFGRAEIHNRDGGDVVDVEVTDSDMAQLATWPIFGHPARDWTARIVEQARWEFESLVLSPVIGQSPAKAIPARASDASNAFLTSVRDSITQAYISGTQAASEEWRQYLASIQ